ncbi:MAG: hypothetical protein WBP22_03165 [Candidatus Saccharimonas sp.]
MTTNSSAEHTPYPEPTEGLTVLQLLRKECGQEYTEQDRQFEAFVTGLIARLEAYTEIVRIIEAAEQAKSAGKAATTSTNSPRLHLT